MTSEAVTILTKPHDEFQVNRKIEQIYNELGLNKPQILVFDTIPVCKLAYEFVLIYLNNCSRNLTDEHLKLTDKVNDLSDFKRLSDWNKSNISHLIFGRIHSILRFIERHYDNTNKFSSLLEVKAQLLKNIKPNNVNTDVWKVTPEETQNIHREKIWNNIINSKYDFFEFNFEHYINYIFTEGILFGIFLKDFCIVCRNPKAIFEDESNRLHSTEGYAIEFNDKAGIYFVRGIQFEHELYSKIFINKDITGKEIFEIKNVEQRAIAIQFFGYDKLIKELDAKLIDTKDEFSSLDNMPISYELYDFEMKVGRFDIVRKFRFVKVEDYSTHKKVTLGVPVLEQTSTCIGAIAWTFGMTKEEYKPQIQT